MLSGDEKCATNNLFAIWTKSKKKKKSTVFGLPDDREYAKGWWRRLMAPAHDVLVSDSSSHPCEGELTRPRSLGEVWAKSDGLSEGRSLLMATELSWERHKRMIQVNKGTRGLKRLTGRQNREGDECNRMICSASSGVIPLIQQEEGSQLLLIIGWNCLVSVVIMVQYLRD